jgi:hypothetical protein
MNIRPMALNQPAIWYLGVARCSTFRPKLYLNKRHLVSSGYKDVFKFLDIARQYTISGLT